ncbi:hypothetical protein WR25_09266 [Diploscapter pachys]|uniref:Integrase catalytic domain-containing protein n=1 Tax=Diploscapter pachys TaxID=2018661 RepID=A0A2A2KVU3_9BILA|nr:hypothetical protein WR25_09266 [Diploscapter pachys]
MKWKEYEQLEEELITLSEEQRDLLKSRLESRIQMIQEAKSDVDEATKALLDAAMRDDLDPDQDEGKVVWVSVEDSEEVCAEANRIGNNFKVLYTSVASYIQDQNQRQIAASARAQAAATGQSWQLPAPIPTIVNLRQPVSLPQFSGKIEEFSSFWGIFESTIDRDVTIPTIEKFARLKAALTGEANRVISQFILADFNYENAKKALKDTFGDGTKVNHLLQERLRNLKAKYSHAFSQKFLLQEMMPIVAQLRQRGKNLDDEMFIAGLMEKFSPEIRKEVEKEAISDIEIYAKFNKFTKSVETAIRKMEIDERIEGKSQKAEYKEKANQQKSKEKSQSAKEECMFCKKENHKSLQCRTVTDMKEKIKILTDEGACKKCFRKGHQTSKCFKASCSNCKGLHNIAICLKTAGRPEQPVNQNQNQRNTNRRANVNSIQTNGEPRSTQSSGNGRDNVDVHLMNCSQIDSILPMAKARILAAKGSRGTKTHVFIDTGATRSFVTNEFAKRIGLKQVGKTKLNIKVFERPREEREYPLYRIRFPMRNQKPIEIIALGTASISGELPVARFTQSDRNFLENKGIKLSLQGYTNPVKPEILLGINYLSKFWATNKMQYRLPSGLALMPTVWGYLVHGQETSHADLPTNESVVGTIMVNTIETGKVPDFVQYDNLHLGTTAEEKAQVAQEVWDKFKQTIKRGKNSDGSEIYSVRLPWFPSEEELPTNWSLARRRLEQLVSSPKTDTELLKSMNSVFQEQLEKGVLEIVDPKALPDGPRIHYLPSQAVLTPGKSTPLRIVFDASAHYKGKPSLNVMLHPGPTLLPLLAGNLLRFRIGRYVLLSDVEKAFLQLRLQKVDRDACRCLWLKDISKPLSEENVQTLRFTRVTFGLTSAPFLLAATIRHHIESSAEISSSLREELIRNLYVDNLQVSAETPDGIIEKYQELKKTFSEMSMNLRKFVSNSEIAMDKIPAEDQEIDKIVKVLGIQWDPKSDKLSVTAPNRTCRKLTKRELSSSIASIFDPMGWLTPITLPVKLFLQKLWTQNLDWDEVLPADLQTEWKEKWQSVLKVRAETSRLAANVNKSQPVELILFTDASLLALGATVYIKQGENISLLMAKSKLPDKQIKFTIPKRELDALLIGIKLLKFVIDQLKDELKISNVFCFTDSEVVIGWLKSDPSLKNGVFIRNRTRDIRSISFGWENEGRTVRFGHVSSEDNVADLCTRENMMIDINSSRWWEGPPFLKSNLKERKLFQLKDESGEVQEEVMQVLAEPNENAFPYLERFSSWKKAIKVVAYVRKFIEMTIDHMPESKKSRFLTRHPNLKCMSDSRNISLEEFKRAKSTIIRLHQNEPETKAHFEKLRQNLVLEEDAEGIIRHISRLQKSDLPIQAKRTICIRPNSTLASLIIMDIHHKFHKPIDQVKNDVRREYSIRQLPSQVVRIVQKCIRCRRFNSLPYRYPNMTDLPERRVKISRPFEHTGLDFFGPLMIREDGEKKKVWGCLFTCACTRMIHLEMAHDLSVRTFINCLKRFFARRGVPTSISSDNAPSFLAGEEILGQAFENWKQSREINEELLSYETEWKHSVPYAPWQGGWWERLVKTVKHAMRKSIGREVLTRDSMQTALIEIEAIVNCRPLVSKNEEEITALRPIDFVQKNLIIQFPFSSIEIESDDYVPMITTKDQAEMALAESEKMIGKFWTEWEESYLTELKEKHRKRMNTRKSAAIQPQIGHVVLVMDENQEKGLWKLARILKLDESADGQIRSAQIRIGATGNVVQKPINLLVPLEISQTDESQTTSESDEEKSESSNNSKQNQVNEETKIENRYDLRPRKPVPYSKMDKGIMPDGDNFSAMAYIPKKLSALLLTVLTIMCLFTPITAEKANSTKGLVRCVEKGIEILLIGYSEYTLCVNKKCTTKHDPETFEHIEFPPEVLAFEQEIRFKMGNKETLEYIEETCPRHEFCSSITCSFCSDIFVNPECWPPGAIIMYAIVAILLALGGYALFNVPVIIGSPILMLMHAVKKIIRLNISIFCLIIRISRAIIRVIKRRICKQEMEVLEMESAEILATVRSKGHGKKKRIKWLTALAISMSLLSGVDSLLCEDFELKNGTQIDCDITNGTSKACNIDFETKFELNEAKTRKCLSIRFENSIIGELRVKWSKAISSCEPQITTYTMDIAESRMADQTCFKECPEDNKILFDYVHSTWLQSITEAPNSSLRIIKCRDILCPKISEWLAISNLAQWPRAKEIGLLTLTPNYDELFTIEECNTWRKAIDLETYSYFIGQDPDSRIVTIPDSQSKTIGAFNIELKESEASSLVKTQSFIRSKSRGRALWQNPYVEPKISCESEMATQNIRNCRLADRCRCPGYIYEECSSCESVNPSDRFLHTEYRLPTGMEGIWFKESNGEVQATSEDAKRTIFHVKIQTSITLDSQVKKTTCHANSTELTGCYRCSSGAVSTVTCYSNNGPTTAQLQCSNDINTITCSPEGSSSILTFDRSTADPNEICKLKCNEFETDMELKGKLIFLPPRWSAVQEVIKSKMSQSESNETITNWIMDKIQNLKELPKWSELSSLNFSKLTEGEKILNWTKNSFEVGLGKANSLLNSAQETAAELKEKMVPDTVKVFIFLANNRWIFVLALVVFIIIGGMIFVIVTQPAFFLAGLLRGSIRVLWYSCRVMLMLIRVFVKEIVKSVGWIIKASCTRPKQNISQVNRKKQRQERKTKIV